MFDLLVAWVLLLVLSPLFVCIAVVSVFFHRGRILFRQERVGRYGRKFRMLKFRTMNDGRDGQEHLLPDDERTTRFGAFLRRYSLDELPQIVHVIAGRMSLVGPRPLLPEHVADCTPEEFRRHDARPGITGLAQVRGRNDIPFQSRFRYDVWYVAHTSWGVDAFIFIQTFRVVLRPEKRR